MVTLKYGPSLLSIIFLWVPIVPFVSLPFPILNNNIGTIHKTKRISNPYAIFLGEILGCLTRLRKLHFGRFSAEEEELEEYPIQLEELSLIGWKKLEHLPHQIQHLTALRELRLQCFHGIEALPDWLGNLSSLQSLDISYCSSLRYVKAIQRLSNLKQLDIFRCHELRERCAKESGSEWNNISHIPRISIHGRNISHK
ncbi:hypothetical protein SLA2020_493470 [Shorea laevis]